MVSRPRGSLLDLEYSILAAIVDLELAGADAYGFGIARRLSGGDPARDLIGHGTLYKALSRLTARGLLTSTWESDEDSGAVGRPRRRLYSITTAGSRALASRPAADTPRAARTALA